MGSQDGSSAGAGLSDCPGLVQLITLVNTDNYIVE